MTDPIPSPRSPEWTNDPHLFAAGDTPNECADCHLDIRAAIHVRWSVPSPRSPQPDPLLVAWRRTKDFLRERLETSGRSDVNINAVLREMNSAFDDSSAPIPSPDTDLRAALERLVAVVDAASIVWHDPVPADAMGAIHNAKSTLAALSSSESTETLDAAPERPTLDEAWREAEAALPEGWRLSDVGWWPDEWHATAEPRPASKSVPNHFPGGRPGTMWLGKQGKGPTAIAALRSLAARLTDSREQTR